MEKSENPNIDVKKTLDQKYDVKSIIDESSYNNFNADVKMEYCSDATYLAKEMIVKEKLPRKDAIVNKLKKNSINIIKVFQIIYVQLLFIVEII